jgi:hypothetical protein
MAPMTTLITEEEIEKARTPRGGWTRLTLQAWGVPWPPPHGWRRHIVKFGIPYSNAPDAPPATNPKDPGQPGFDFYDKVESLCRRLVAEGHGAPDVEELLLHIELARERMNRTVPQMSLGGL